MGAPEGPPWVLYGLCVLGVVACCAALIGISVGVLKLLSYVLN